jgi:type IV pilus assembly protein PilM
MGLLGKSKGGATVGIDIGSKLIKVVEAREGKEGVQISSIGIAPTPAGAIENEIIIDPQSVGQALKQLLSESGISTKRCVSSVAGQSCVVVRIIEVPKMTKQELAETMKWEVERHVPFAADDVIMDFLPVERPDADPNDQNMEVLLAVAQQEVISAHIETLFAAGLKPAAIDVEPLAVCRSLIDASEGVLKEQTVAVISIGALVTELGIYRNSLLVFPRTLPVAGDSITRAITEGLGISEEQAERIKRERASVLLDRISTLGIGMDLGGVDTDVQGANSTQEISPNDQYSDSGFSFIPGLDVSSPEPSSSQSNQPGTPDFDIDVGIPAQAPKPVLDFDLAVHDEAAPASPKPALDLSAGEDQPGEGDFDLSSLSLIGDESDDRFTDEQIFDAMASALTDLITEIRRSLDYYFSKYQSQPDKILLCGGTAKLKNLNKLIETEIGVPVDIANPLQNVSVFSNALSEDYLEEVASVLPVSVGLAIRDMIGE